MKPVEGDPASTEGLEESTNTADGTETHSDAPGEAAVATVQSKEGEGKADVEVQETDHEVARDEPVLADVEADESTVSVKVIENAADVDGNVTIEEAGDSLDTTSSATANAGSTDPDGSAPAGTATDVSVVDRSDPALDAAAESVAEANLSRHDASANLEVDNTSAVAANAGRAEIDQRTVTEVQAVINPSDTAPADSASDAADSASDAASDSSDSAADAVDEGNDEARNADSDSHEGSAESRDGNAESSDGGTQSDASEASAAAKESDRDSSSEPSSSEDSGDSEVNVKPVEGGDRGSIEVSQETTDTVDDEINTAAQSNERGANSGVEPQAGTTVEANESTVSVEASGDAPEGQGKVTLDDAGESLDTTKDVTAKAGRTDPDESAPAHGAADVSAVTPSEATIDTEAESGGRVSASVYDAGANLELDTTSAVAADASRAEVAQRTVTEVQGAIDSDGATIGAEAESVTQASGSPQDSGANLELDTTSAVAANANSAEVAQRTVTEMQGTINPSDAAIGAEADSGDQASASVYDAGANLQVDNTTAVTANASESPRVDVGAAADSVIEADVRLNEAGANLQVDTTSGGTADASPTEHEIDLISARGLSVTEVRGELSTTDTALGSAADSVVEADVSPHDAGAKLEVDTTSAATFNPIPTEHEIDLVSAHGATVTEGRGALNASDPALDAAAESVAEADLSRHDASANLEVDKATAVTANPTQSAQVELDAAADSVVEANVSRHDAGAKLEVDTTSAATANPIPTEHEVDLVSAHGSTVTEGRGALNASDPALDAAAESVAEANLSRHDTSANLEVDNTTAVTTNASESPQVDVGSAADSFVEASVSRQDASADLELDNNSAVTTSASLTGRETVLVAARESTVTEVQGALDSSAAEADSLLQISGSPDRAGAKVELDVTATGPGVSASPSGSTIRPVLDAVTAVAGAVHSSDGVQVDVGGGAVSNIVHGVGVVTKNTSSALVDALAEAAAAVESSATVATPAPTAVASVTQSLNPRVGDLGGEVTEALGGFPVHPVGLAGAVVGPASSRAPPPAAVELAALNGSPRGRAVSSGGAFAGPAAPAGGRVSGAGPSDHTSAPSGAARLPGLRLRAPPHPADVYPAQAAAAASPPSSYAPFGAASPAGDSPVRGVPPAPVGGGLASSAGSMLSGGGGGFDNVPALAGEIAASLALALLGLLFASRTILRSHLHGPLVSPG